jgi:endonuclease III
MRTPRRARSSTTARPFELLVAVVLSAQATDKGVNRATAKAVPRRQYAREKILALGEEGLKAYINSIGLYNAKAKNVVALCRILLEEHGGEVPRDRAALEALPGVGRKTANVVLNTAFGEPLIAVDTHIFRVANRTGLAPGKTVRAVEDRLARVDAGRIPEGCAPLADPAWPLRLQGAQARLPACVVADLCDYRMKTPGEPPAHPLIEGRPQGRARRAAAE